MLLLIIWSSVCVCVGGGGGGGHPGVLVTLTDDNYSIYIN